MKSLPPPPYSEEDPSQSDPQLRGLPTRVPVGRPLSSIPLQQHTQFSPAQRPSLQTSSLERPERAISRPATSIPSPWSSTQSNSYGLDLEKGGFISARPYFHLRSYDYPRPRDTVYHLIIISHHTCPENLSYPQPKDKWSERAVDSHDWDTFLNHLFPKHSVESHALSTHKQLKGGSGLPLQGLRIRARPGEASSPSSGIYPGSELGKSTDPYGDNGETERLRQLRINAVTVEWNEGFFEPRGLKIIIDFERPSSSPTISTGPSLQSLPTIQSTSSTSSTPSTPSPTSPTSPTTGPSARVSSLIPGTSGLGPITPQRTANVLQKAAPPPKPEETLLHQAVAKGSKSKVEKILLKDGIENLETPDFKGETALYRAVFRGETQIVKLLLEKGANPAARPPGCHSTLHIAVSRDRTSILDMLLERCTKDEIEETTSTGETALYLAIQRRNESSAKALLARGANPQARPAGKESMLNCTVTFAQKSLVKVLLEHGADVEERNKDGDPPLCRSVIRGDTKIVEILLKHGAKGSARTSKGESPLSIAVSRGRTGIVALLLNQKDIDVEVKNLQGETPLYTAVTKGESAITRLLLIKGASPTVSPPTGETVLNFVVSKGDTALTHILLERGVDLEVRNKSGETPLFKAVSRSDSSITSLLVGKGALVNTMNKDGETALYKAVYKGCTSIVSLLLCNGANTETPGPNGETPLYRAVYKGNTSIVSLLLCNGANPETPSPLGETPLYRAVSKNETGIVSLLLGRGASPDVIAGNGDTPMEYATKKGNKTVLQLLNNYAPRKVG
jgi:ankyrin repeat protein